MGRKKDQYKAHSGLFTSKRNPGKRPRSETEQDEATPTVSGFSVSFVPFVFFPEVNTFDSKINITALSEF